MTSKSTAVAKATERQKPALSPEREARIQEARERNEMVKAIRATMWGSNVTPQQAGAIANYCLLNRIDAVRHVDVLGGKLYLNAEFYRERGAHLIRDGIIEALEPDFINVDPRLDELATAGDQWAIDEKARRLKLRIQHNAPEEAKAICVYAFRVKASGSLITGVNWCGGGTKKKMITDRASGQKKLIDADPIGDLEPTKTAESRAERRAWRKIAEVIPAYGQAVKPIEEGVRSALPVAVVEAEQPEPQRPIATEDPYMLGAGEPSDEDLLRQDRELADAERRED